MAECFGSKFILNGELKPAELFDNSLVYNGDSVYEVIRMVDGKPLFFNDHMERLEASAVLQGKELPAGLAELKKAILLLSRSVNFNEINIKVVLNYNTNKNNYLIYCIESFYPTGDEYKYGVKGILFHAERKDPGSKVLNPLLRSAIYENLLNELAYEALLVNKNNLITEGSRSNIFFLKNDILYTAPDFLILNGITRKYILEICSENGIPVELSCVNADQLPDFEAVFMTGTSPKVLPFRNIGNTLFNVNHPLMERLRRLYMLKADESIRLFRPE